MLPSPSALSLPLENKNPGFYFPPIPPSQCTHTHPQPAPSSASLCAMQRRARAPDPDTYLAPLGGSAPELPQKAPSSRAAAALRPAAPGRGASTRGAGRGSCPTRSRSPSGSRRRRCCAARTHRQALAAACTGAEGAARGWLLSHSSSSSAPRPAGCAVAPHLASQRLLCCRGPREEGGRGLQRGVGWGAAHSLL